MDEYLPNKVEAVEEDKYTSTDEMVTEKDQTVNQLKNQTLSKDPMNLEERDTIFT